MTTLIGLCLGLGLGSALVGWGFISGGFPLAGIIMVLAGVACLVAQFKWQGLASLGFFIFSILAALGILFNYSIILMFSGEILLLVGWDLSAFYHHLRLSSEDDQRIRLEQMHISRLIPILLLGIGLSIWVLVLHLRISFEWGALLLVIGALGTSVLLRRLLFPDP